MRSISRRSFLAATALASTAVAVRPAWAATDTATGAAKGLSADFTLGTADFNSVIPSMSAQSDASSNPNLSTRVTTREFSGATRYDTAASIAREAYPSGSESAVIVGGETGWPDALAAACLAASKGPILPVGKSDVPDVIMSTMKTMGVKSVVVVGGLNVVGVGAHAALEKEGITVEQTLAGDDRQGTQLEVLKYGLENDLFAKDLIILAAGENFPDALAASPVSFALRAPIFIAGAGGLLSDEQKAAWREAAEAGFGQRVALVGGEAVLPAATKDFAGEMRSLAHGSGIAERVAGENRYDTSAEIARWAVENFGFTWDNAAFTTGAKPWDALTGSVLQGKSKSVMLLADSMYSSSISAAGYKKSLITNLRLFGGKASIVPSTRMAIADALGFPAAAMPNFRLYLDAGHGPNDSGGGTYDPGACGSGYEEYDLTKELANLVAPLLRARGVDVFVNDDGGPYRLRHAEAVSQGCDAILSIHFNAGGGSGSMSLIHEYNDNEYSATWQSKIHPALASSLGLHDYGMNRQEVAILGGQLPAVLLEICFIDNSYDMQKYQSSKNSVAAKIAQAVMS